MEDYFKKITKYYKPSQPIEMAELFVGREREQSNLYKTLLTNGRHPIIYGDRGIGKTSLVNITCKHFCFNNDYILIKHICSSNDTFGNIFNTFLRNSSLNIKEEKRTKKSTTNISSGFDLKILKSDIKGTESTELTYSGISETLLSPSLISEIYEFRKFILVIDEFDQIKNEDEKRLIADTIKALSDRNSETTIVLSGVGNSLSDLVKVHNSTLRNLISIEVPRMSNSELLKIIQNGTEPLNIEFSQDLIEDIIWLSDGLPYFTHLISECLADYSHFNNKYQLSSSDLKTISSSISNNMALKEIIELNYKRCFYDSNSFFSTPFNDMSSQINNYSKTTIETVIHLFSKVNVQDNNKFQQIIFEYNNLKAKLALDNIEIIDIEIILEGVSKRSEILINLNGVYYFKDTFHKAYIRLKALN